RTGAAVGQRERAGQGAIDAGQRGELQAADDVEGCGEAEHVGAIERVRTKIVQRIDVVVRVLSVDHILIRRGGVVARQIVIREQGNRAYTTKWLGNCLLEAELKSVVDRAPARIAEHNLSKICVLPRESEAVVRADRLHV